MNPTSLIALRDVVKKFKTGDTYFTALKGIDLDVQAGEFVSVIGKSGSGKSTMINMITGIDRPSSGQVWVDGVELTKMSEGQIAAWRGRQIGLVFQFFQLLPTLTVLENVMLPMDFCNMYKRKERRERARHLLNLMGMADHGNKLPSKLSGGQQQRVAIARSLANDPPLIVADEPTGNLDSRTAESVFKFFYELVDEGKTILMVTHDDELAAQTPRLIRIHDGEIVAPDHAAMESLIP